MKKSLIKIISFRSIILVLLSILILLFFYTAWISDDAYITFRSIENFLSGYGPVFNVGERVQAFTHPLWFFVQSAANAITREISALNPWAQMYYVNVLLSISFSTAAVLILIFRIARSLKGLILGLVILILSKGFIDYATSGLENALSYFIVACFLAIFLAEEDLKPLKVLWLAIIASLGTINRMDTILFFIPALIYAVWMNPERRKSLFYVIIGFIPFLVWEVFSLFYYGFPFPNTAYAKLNTGIRMLEILIQGFKYFQSSFRLDPVIFFVFLGCLLWFSWKGTNRQRMVMFGMVIYMIYIVYIGGDFMAVRYFSVPVFICAALLSVVEFPSRLAYASILIAVILIGLINPKTPLRSQAGFVPVDSNIMIDKNQVSDERLYYYHNYGWLSTSRDKPLPGSNFAGKDWIFNPKKRKVVLVGPLGVRGYQAGPNIHMIDKNALADPLMTRLPIIDNRFWRIGHFDHIIPQGYLSTLDSGENKIIDPDLAQYYEVLKLVIGGELWDVNRIIEIVKLNSGVYDPLLDAFLDRWEAQGKPVDEYK